MRTGLWRAAGWWGLLVVMALARDAHAQARRALVIGNAAYAHAGRLTNPPNDAAAIAASLRSVGFTVTLLTDLGKDALVDALKGFARDSVGADTAVVYFSGHGVEIGGANYLIPTDATLAADTDVHFEAVPLDLVMTAVDRAHRLKVIILDACRDNPYTDAMRRSGGDRGPSVGLAAPIVGGAMLVAYAAREGHTATDGVGANSPYALSLEKRLTERGVDVRIMFGEVHDDVLAATGGRQEPTVYTSIGGGALYLAPPDPTPPAPIPAPQAPPPVPVAAAPSPAAVPAAPPPLAPVPPPPPSPSKPPVGTFAADARTLGAGLPAPVLAPGAQPRDFQAFRDCPDCLDMVALPGGAFTMGSPRDEAGRDADEDPAPVVLPRFAISRFPVTLGQYAAFADETGRGAPGGCITSRIAAGRWTANPSATWRRPAFTAGDRDPVVCVSWADAQAFAAWMKTKTGQTYRLVSESEYEYATRAGATTAYFWGPDAGGACAHANGADAAARRAFPISRALACDDGFARLSPVGSFNPNAWGLYDIAGDVWSWTADCYAASYQANPKNGLPLDLDMCGDRVVRGGSWLYDPFYLRSAARGYNIPDFRNYQVGFRVGRSLGPLDAGPP